MRWRTGRKSDNVEDRRGMRRVARPMVGGGLGIVVIVVVAMLFGVDPQVVLNIIQVGDSPVAHSPQTSSHSPQNDELANFVSVVLADTEDTWKALFQKEGKQYKEPKLVLFTGLVQSACGRAQASTGPFYCPADQKVYIDLDFYRELKERYKAPGDFAQAYVIAHEIGHHVQTLLGISKQVHTLRQKMDQVQANKLLVRQELQADCFAGIWAHHAHKARQVIEEGDVEEALNAASSIGDDRLQKQSRGYAVPDTFTHGTSAQRMHWFKTGIQTGDINACNTFEANI